MFLYYIVIIAGAATLAHSVLRLLDAIEGRKHRE